MLNILGPEGGQEQGRNKANILFQTSMILILNAEEGNRKS